jgi:hypothetical protein
MGRDALLEPEKKTDATLERAVVCRECKHALSKESERIEVGGKPQHTFVNPHAYAFTIVCFKIAPGCVGFGERSTYWSWFERHAWRIALCGGCSAHVGWSFEGESSFHGLVIDRIAIL